MSAFSHLPLPALLPPSGETKEILAATVQHMQHAPSSLMIWSGPPGHGKTMASWQLREYLIQRCAGHRETVAEMEWGGALNGKSTRGMHRGLATVYRRFVADESPAFIRRQSEQQLSEDIVEAFKRAETISLYHR